MNTKQRTYPYELQVGSFSSFNTTQLKSFSELVELWLFAPTQLEIIFELVKLPFIVTTQIENPSKLVELTQIAPTQNQKLA